MASHDRPATAAPAAAPGTGPAGTATRSLPIAGLTAAQHAAVMAEDPVVCVLAGAGAGKTRVLTLRVARRALDRSASLAHVLVLTFSRKAADELGDRLWALDMGAGVHAGTFHRAAWRLVRQRYNDLGRRPPALMADRKPLLAEVLRNARDPGAQGLRPAGAAGRRSGTGRRTATVSERGEVSRIEAEIGWAKARLLDPEAYAEAAPGAGRRPPAGVGQVAELYARYEVERHRRGVVDMDDLLWMASDILEDERFAAAVRWRHRHIYVDEMQDLNEAQFGLLRRLVGPDSDLFVVGDPNQSVYGWNGADPRLLERVPDVFGTARVIRLDANHRCSPQVVRTAAAVLEEQSGHSSGARHHGRPPVDRLWTHTTPAPTSTRLDGPVPRVVRHDTDVAEAAWVAKEVWRAHRPGRRWSRIAVLARTNAQLGRIAQVLAAERIPCRVAGAEVGPGSDLPADGIGPGDRRFPGAGAGHDGHDGNDGNDGHDDETDDGDAAADDAVVLSTFHRAKGLEWPVVFVTGLADGLVPLAGARSRDARDEERRLLYVALTRAERELTCSWAERAGDGTVGRERHRRPSPWLKAIEQAVADLTAESAGADPEHAAAHLAAIRAQLAAVADDPCLEGQSKPRQRSTR